MYKFIIAGSRDYKDYEAVKIISGIVIQSVINTNRLTHDDVEIVSGCAKGVDTLAIKFAEEKGYKLTKFPAQWDEFGKSAGYIRNADMADYSDYLIAFWDGVSKGTKHMIDLAKKNKLGYYVYITVDGK